MLCFRTIELCAVEVNEKSILNPAAIRVTQCLSLFLRTEHMMMATGSWPRSCLTMLAADFFWQCFAWIPYFLLPHARAEHSFVVNLPKHTHTHKYAHT